MKILYLVNVPAPYMVNYFNELGKYCDLTVIFEKSTSEERHKSWQNYIFKNFKGIILKGISMDVDMAFCPQIIKYLKKNMYDFIFSSTMTTPTGILAIEYMKLMKIPFYLESEGGFAKNGKGFKEWLKKFIMKGAEGYFSTTPIGDNYFLTYGADKKKIYKYPFTSLYKRDILKKPVEINKKLELRRKLDIKEENVIITVGRFIYCKGFDLLIKAASKLDKSIGVYIVGGYPNQEYLNLCKENNAINIHFEQYKNKDDLKEYYMAADIFILPTREDTWGLVINEAMAYGLPIITTDHCIVGVELVNNENGKIIPINSVDAIVDAVNDILKDSKHMTEMAIKSLEKIQWYTFENMVKVHLEFFKNNNK
ncbi:glycosyltransferase family 4 protein [uncultured Fusobacterium sp.]|uniref:glycosyltransferase family 4 protein n=1 Tax=uncultured Fusobacterium sp. TaxID=159267 RepID=UPI0025900896|nr:glycosyltransferase [uncultured Fusobacterium sp.]